jgi:hypothetical protein
MGILGSKFARSNSWKEEDGRRIGGGWEDEDEIMVHLIMCIREERCGITTAKGSGPSSEESMSM